MKPLICFYRENQFIYSEDYILKYCSAEKRIADFLNEIEAQYKSDLKVVQVNFEYENTALFAGKKELYPSDKASVFILNRYSFLTAEQLLAALPESTEGAAHKFTVLEEKTSFLAKVNLIKKEISQGRIYQVNLTSPLVSLTTLPSEIIFKNYFSQFNGDYKAVLPLREYDLISFSPELFLKKHGTRLTTQPIKGSLALTGDFARDLVANKKEEAELSMIVDLLRNDFNRIEEAHSAAVTVHRAPLHLGYIQHTYSEIEIETARNLAAVLEATAPGGSISGCPKIESLKLISELEIYKRQAYTGTLGWWQNDDFCLNLSIRSFMKSQDRLFYHSGCGIVYDSDALKEWDEFIMKTGHLNVQ